MKRLLALTLALMVAQTQAKSTDPEPSTIARGGPCLVQVSSTGIFINANALTYVRPDVKENRVYYVFARYHSVEIVTTTPVAETERTIKIIEAKCGGTK